MTAIGWWIRRSTSRAAGIISAQELARLLPGYERTTSTGAAVWHDAQIYNSERLLLEFILSAVDAGAEAANYVEAIDFLREGDRITGVKARELLTGQDLRNSVQNGDQLLPEHGWKDLLETVPTSDRSMAPPIAMNLIVDQIWSGHCGGIAEPACKRQILPDPILSSRGGIRPMIGTWHIPWNKAPDEFKMNEALVQDCINEINSAHPSLRLSLEDVQHVTWGFLPVDQKEDAAEGRVKLTRDGVVIDHQGQRWACRPDQRPGCEIHHGTRGCRTGCGPGSAKTRQ